MHLLETPGSQTLKLTRSCSSPPAVLHRGTLSPSALGSGPALFSRGSLCHLQQPQSQVCALSAVLREVMNWGGAAPTFFLTGTTCRRKGTGFLADISNGLKMRKMYLRGTDVRMRPKLICWEVIWTLRRTLVHNRLSQLNPPHDTYRKQRGDSVKSHRRLQQPNVSIHVRLKQPLTEPGTAPLYQVKTHHLHK